MTFSCPFCHREMQQPLMPTLPEREYAIWSLVLSGGSGGVHHTEISKHLAINGWKANNARVRQLVHYLNRNLYKQGLEQKIAAVRQSGRYRLFYQENDNGQAAEESAEKTDMEVHLPAEGEER